MARLEAARPGRGAVHVLLHPGLASEALERWKVKAMTELPLAALVVVPQRGLR